MTDAEDGFRQRPKAVEAAAEIAAVGLGFAVQGPAGAVVAAAATPYVLDVVHRAWDEITSLRQESIARVIARAATELDRDPVRVVNAALATEDGTALLADALRAASETLNRQKVDALARALANGLADDQARVDEQRLVIRAIADLEAPHISLLVRMKDPGPPNEARWFSGHDIFDLYGASARIGPGALRAVMQLLEGNGLIDENHDDQAKYRTANQNARLEAQFKRVTNNRGPVLNGGQGLKEPDRKWRVTQFGVEVVDYLTARGEGRE